MDTQHTLANKPLDLPASDAELDPVSTAATAATSIEPVDAAETELNEGAMVTALTRDLKQSIRTVRQQMRVVGAALVEAVAPTVNVFALEYIQQLPPDDVQWMHIRLLLQSNVDEAEAVIRRLKERADAELRNGDRAAEAVALTRTPMDQIRFQALLDDLYEAWQPRNGIERRLLEQMAMSHTQFLYWMMVHGARTSHALLEKDEPLDRWQQPRVTDSKIIEKSAQLMEQHQRMFLKALRQLQDMRRCGHSVVVQTARQVNVGAQQVNLVDGSD